MNLFETLKQFKNILPDPAYTEKSKRMVLATVPRERLSPSRILAHVFETGVAVALAVFFILIITGQFSNLPYVSPVQFSVINPTTLHAEAQAVDVQIQLANVAYVAPTSTMAITNETTPQAAVMSGTSSLTTTALVLSNPGSTAAASSSASTTTTAASATSSPVSIDQALQELSK